MYTAAYDDKLVATIPFYQQYPQLLPLVGSGYAIQQEKMLFIGESHYLPNNSTLHLDPDTWYQKSMMDLNKEEMEWTNTRLNAGSGHQQKYYSKAYSIYRNLEKAVLEHGFNPDDKSNLFRYWAYYNYFQRPAKTGSSLSIVDLDQQIAINVFSKLVELLEVKHVFFLSKLAYSSFNQSRHTIEDLQDLVVHCIPHPGSAWWNRKSKAYRDDHEESLSGKEYLKLLLRRHALFPGQ